MIKACKSILKRIRNKWHRDILGKINKLSPSPPLLPVSCAIAEIQKVYAALQGDESRSLLWGRLEPKISIIIPIYNIEKYLGLCLTSVLNQTLREIEVICVDDGSTDGSPAILEDYARRDRRIVVIRQEHSGVANARNRGLERVSAPYVGFVDSDDCILPEMYEKMYDAMESHGVDFAECGAEVVFSCPFSKSKEALRLWLSYKHQGRVEDRRIFQVSCHELWKMLFRRDLLDRYALRFEEGFHSNEDATFVYSYKSVARNGYYMGENLYLYFQHENSLMAKTRTKTAGLRSVEQLKTGEVYYNFLIKNGIFEELKFYFWGYYINCIIFFYDCSDPGIIKLYGPKTIKAFLSGKDLSYLKDSRYFVLGQFQKLPDEKLYDWAEISAPPVSKKASLKRVVKWFVPYGVLRLKDLLKRHR